MSLDRYQKISEEFISVAVSQYEEIFNKVRKRTSSDHCAWLVTWDWFQHLRKEASQRKDSNDQEGWY